MRNSLLTRVAVIDIKQDSILRLLEKGQLIFQLIKAVSLKIKCPCSSIFKNHPEIKALYQSCTDALRYSYFLPKKSIALSCETNVYVWSFDLGNPLKILVKLFGHRGLAKENCKLQISNSLSISSSEN